MAIGSARLPRPQPFTGPPVDPTEAAAFARLRYVTDTAPGIARVRAGKGFRYLTARGEAVRDAETLNRIRALVIPPAWTRVWICPTATGHIQAVGRDARGRKQYRYHSRWRAVGDEPTYKSLFEFVRSLPSLRHVLSRRPATSVLPRARVLATVYSLSARTRI